MDVARSLVYETTVFLVTHSGSSFTEFLSGFPLEPVTFDLQYFWLWPFLPHLLQVKFDLTDHPPTDPTQFPLRTLLKSNFFKYLLINCSSGFSGIPIKVHPEFESNCNFLCSMINNFYISSSYRSRPPHLERNMVHDNFILLLIFNFPFL